MRKMVWRGQCKKKVEAGRVYRGAIGEKKNESCKLTTSLPSRKITGEMVKKGFKNGLETT